jgi:polyhydroxybutyrate depolymerase
LITEKSYSLSFCMCLVLVVMLACGQTAPSLAPPPALATFETLAPGDTTRSLSYGGEERTYVLHIPSAYDPSKATPVVLIFHGFGLNAEEMIRITGFNAQADTSGFIAVYPNGTGHKPSWNGGDCCGEAAARKVDDVGFARALIEDLSKSVNVDRKRIYATGFSNGAMMAYWLACELSDQVAAIAPVGATQAVQSCQAGRPVSVLHFHGTNDQLNPYDGGYGPGGKVNFAPVKDTIQFWVKQNGCPVQAQVKEAGNIVNERYSPCAQNTAVELYTIVGGEHAWPGGESISEEIGAPTTEILATPLIWEFFTAHPMP